MQQNRASLLCFQLSNVNQADFVARSFGLSAVKSFASGAVTEASKVINWEQLRQLMRYESWPDVPRWVKLALKIGGGAFLMYKVWMWFWNRKSMASWHRAWNFYKTFIPVAVSYKRAEARV